MLASSACERFLRWISADAVPRSWNNSTKPITTAAIATRPKSDGASRRARTMVVSRERARRPKCEIADHFNPEIADFLIDIGGPSRDRRAPPDPFLCLLESIEHSRDSLNEHARPGESVIHEKSLDELLTTIGGS